LEHIRPVARLDAEASPLQSLREIPVTAGLLILLLGPLFPIFVDRRGRGRILSAPNGSFVEPAPKQVLGCEVFIRCGTHSCRGIQSFPLPFDATFKSPVKDCGPLLLELLGQVGVALMSRNDDREWDQAKPAADRFVNCAQSR